MCGIDWKRIGGHIWARKIDHALIHEVFNGIVKRRTIINSMFLSLMKQTMLMKMLWERLL